MLKKTITYTDFNDTQRTEVFYFNLTKAEITEMEMTTEGGLQSMLSTVVQTKDAKRIVELFKELILKAYGVKSEDGKRFVKSKELSEEFSQTEAFSELFMELATNADASAAFVNGIIPTVTN